MGAPLPPQTGPTPTPDYHSQSTNRPLRNRPTAAPLANGSHFAYNVKFPLKASKSFEADSAGMERERSFLFGRLPAAPLIFHERVKKKG